MAKTKAHGKRGGRRPTTWGWTQGERSRNAPYEDTRDTDKSTTQILDKIQQLQRAKTRPQKGGWKNRINEPGNKTVKPKYMKGRT